eukprot:scaffold10856_cov229-Amphora_coffeaeformis.AAC.19
MLVRRLKPWFAEGLKPPTLSTFLDITSLTFQYLLCGVCVLFVPSRRAYSRRGRNHKMAAEERVDPSR